MPLEQVRRPLVTESPLVVRRIVRGNAVSVRVCPIDGVPLPRRAFKSCAAIGDATARTERGVLTGQ
jgi:hypothetical protein